jgi:flagellar biosynthesis regulator FlbT
MLFLLSIVMMQVDLAIAPRKTEKYVLQTNTMAHFANEHKSRVIEHHLRLLDRYVINEEVYKELHRENIE